MNTVKITHFFDVINIKKEPIFEDQRDVPHVANDPSNVEQKYQCKEELDVTWDERDNDYGACQENYDFSNTLSYKLGFPIVVIKRLPNDVIDKYSPTVQRESGFENSVTSKCKNRDFLQYYQKFCTECEQREPSEKKTRKCKNCDIQWNYECKKCSKQLSTWGGIVYHLNIKCIEKGQNYACFKCNYRSAFKSQVRQHLKNVHSILYSRNPIEEFNRDNVQNDVAFINKMHKCPKCGQQFEKLPPLLRHTQTCGQAKNNVTNFVAPKSAYRNQCIHYCSQCNQTVNNVGVGNFNQKKCQNCHSKFSFKCIKCNQIFKSYSAIYQHLKTKHKDVKDVLTCPECNYKTSSFDNLATHVRRLHFIESRECPQCGRKCKNQIIFREHLRICIKERKFQCDYCSYRFKSKGILKRHIVVLHSVGNEIDCFQCGITLKNDNCFKSHITYCKKELHHRCSRCSFKTKYKSHLKYHCKTAHDKSLKKQACTNCAKKYKNKLCFSRHLRNCGKSSELSCDYCDRLFKVKIDLAQHIIRAHSQHNDIDIAYNLPYLHCDHCLYKTKFKDDLAKHVTIHLESSKKVSLS